MRLILIRHGQTDSNVQRLLDTAHPGAPLNELGLQQAAGLVETLGHEPAEAIYASTLTRAQQTAAPLAEHWGLEVQVIDGIHEILAGVEEMSADWTGYVRVLESWSPENLDVGLEGGETARQFLTRYHRAVQEIEQSGHEVAALVSHGAALRVFGLTVAPGLRRELAAELLNTEWITMEGSTADGWSIRQWGPHIID